MASEVGLKISQVLVGTDGSDAARNAVRLAAEIANRYGAHLTIAYVVPGPPPGRDVALRNFDEAVDRVGWMLLETASEHVHVPVERVETRLLRGDPPSQLSALAEKLDADLVVVGSRGHGPLRRLVLGSVSDQVVHVCSKPVLVAR